MAEPTTDLVQKPPPAIPPAVGQRPPAAPAGESAVQVTRSRRIYTPRALLQDVGQILTRAGDLSRARRHRQISRAFGEKIMLTVTAVNDCRYCSYAHARMALRSGVTPQDVELLLSGELGSVPPEEAPALFFAQHYAGTGGQPDPDMVERLAQTYGEEVAAGMLAQIRMINLANLAGNTFDALVGRLRGRPTEGSSLWSELSSLGLLGLTIPILPFAILVHTVRRR